MIELSRHIERLLLENDCVILPEIGGFIAHYVPAKWVTEENRFFPPTRVIGFNPQLKINDGLLVQSYMTTYGINFATANKQVEKLLQNLVKSLHEEGQVCLPRIGELKYSIEGTYNFVAYDNSIVTPHLYGLSSFEIKELSKETESKKSPFLPVKVPKHRSFRTRRSLSYLLRGVAMTILVFSLFLFSTPIENTEVVSIDYARLSPDMLFKQIEKQSLVVNPVKIHTAVTKQNTVKPHHSKPFVAKRQKGASIHTASAPTVAKVSTDTQQGTTEQTARQVNSQTQSISMSYHIIVASLATKDDAESMVKDLIRHGFTGAKAIFGDGKKRVCIQSYATLNEAQAGLKEFRQNDAYQQAWILRKKL